MCVTSLEIQEVWVRVVNEEHIFSPPSGAVLLVGPIQSTMTVAVPASEYRRVASKLTGSWTSKAVEGYPNHSHPTLRFKFIYLLYNPDSAGVITYS